jgi:hypothetical protein
MAHVLRITPETRRLLAAVWRAKGKPPLTIHPDQVADAAKELRVVIPDDVVAIVIAEGRLIGALPALTLEVTTYFDATHGKGKWRGELEFDHVVFARLPSDDSEPLYASFRRGSAELALWDVRRPTRGGVKATLAEYLARGGTTGTATAEEVAAFQPVIDLPPPPPPRRVTHPTFGTGTVLEKKDGKLRIDFGAHGVKVIAEKFVRDT